MSFKFGNKCYLNTAHKSFLIALFFNLNKHMYIPLQDVNYSLSKRFIHVAAGEQVRIMRHSVGENERK